MYSGNMIYPGAGSIANSQVRRIDVYYEYYQSHISNANHNNDLHLPKSLKITQVNLKFLFVTGTSAAKFCYQ